MEIERSEKILERFRCFGWWRSPVAHLHGVQEVAGSNPVHPTKKEWGSLLITLFRAVAQPGSALRSGRRGRWFESSLPDEILSLAHFVYIIQSTKDGGFYIGETSDVNQRLIYHNSGKQRSTKHRIPFRLVLTEQFSTRGEALKREKELKSWKGGIKFKGLLAGR